MRLGTGLINLFKGLFFLSGVNLVIRAYNKKSIEAHQLLGVCLQKQPRQASQQRFRKGIRKRRANNWTFVRGLIRVHIRQWIMIWFLALALTLLLASEPYVNSKILVLVKNKDRTVQDMFWIITLLFASKSVKTLVSVHMFYWQNMLGTDILTFLSLMVYQRSLDLSNQNSPQDNCRGKYLTLLEEDCAKMLLFPYMLTQTVLSIAQIVFGLTYLSVQLPGCDFILEYYLAFGYLVVCVVLGLFSKRLAGVLLAKKDLRLSCTVSQIRDGDQNKYKANSARLEEIKALKDVFKLEILIRTLSVFYSALFISCMLVFNYHNINPDQVFVILVLYSQISFPLSQLPFLFQNFYQLLANVSRISDFLSDQSAGQAYITADTPPRHLGEAGSINSDPVRKLKEFRNKGQLSWNAIRNYLSSGGPIILAACFLFKISTTMTGIASSFINKYLANPSQEPATILFFNQFLSVVPFCISISLIFKFSLNASRQIYSKLSTPHDKNSQSVTLNLLSNDLRIIDRIIIIIVFDLLTSFLTILKTIGLCVYSISLIRITYALLVLLGILILISVLVGINRMFMWIRRECSRLEGIARTPFIDSFYESIDCRRGFDVVEGKARLLLRQVVRMQLTGTHYECWYQLILMFVGLVCIVVVVVVALTCIQQVSLVGLILSQILLLDTFIQTFFIGLVSLERNSVAIERLHGIVETESDQSHQSTQTLLNLQSSEQSFTI